MHFYEDECLSYVKYYSVCNEMIVVGTPEQAVTLMRTLHEGIKGGKWRSVHEALKSIKKDRKTVDRFKHIYYMNEVDGEKFEKVNTYHYYNYMKMCTRFFLLAHV